MLLSRVRKCKLDSSGLGTGQRREVFKILGFHKTIQFFDGSHNQNLEEDPVSYR